MVHLANAWRGLEKWNEYFRDDYLDRHLLPGIARPANADLLEVGLCSRCDQQLPITKGTAPKRICVACRATEERQV